MSGGAAILCFGEIVWDSLPEGIFLGGAPLNVAFHLNRMGNAALPVSRVGRDYLGEETRRRLESFDVTTSLIQTDPELRTGTVQVVLDSGGDARYEIVEPAAWDRIGWTPGLAAASGARALVYGSLATRSPGNAEVLEKLIHAIPFRLCDVNLRPPYDDPDNARSWASRADVVKLNEEELERLAPANSGGLHGQARALADQLGAETLVVTRGGAGALVLRGGEFLDSPAPEVEVRDTVGAGDAFTAAFLDALLRGLPAETALQRALRLGALVAGRRGAQPDYDPSALD